MNAFIFDVNYTKDVYYRYFNGIFINGSNVVFTSDNRKITGKIEYDFKFKKYFFDENNYFDIISSIFFINDDGKLFIYKNDNLVIKELQEKINNDILVDNKVLFSIKELKNGYIIYDKLSKISKVFKHSIGKIVFYDVFHYLLFKDIDIKLFSDIFIFSNRFIDLEIVSNVVNSVVKEYDVNDIFELLLFNNNVISFSFIPLNLLNYILSKYPSIISDCNIYVKVDNKYILIDEFLMNKAFIIENRYNIDNRYCDKLKKYISRNLKKPHIKLYEYIEKFNK